MSESGCFIYLFIFSEFLARFDYERNSGIKFFYRFLGLSHPVLAKNIAGKRFFSLLNFSLFFSEFSCPGRIRMEFGIKILISLSRPLSTRFG